MYKGFLPEYRPYIVCIYYDMRFIVYFLSSECDYQESIDYTGHRHFLGWVGTCECSVNVLDALLLGQVVIFACIEKASLYHVGFSK